MLAVREPGINPLNDSILGLPCGTPWTLRDTSCSLSGMWLITRRRTLTPTRARRRVQRDRPHMPPIGRMAAASATFSRETRGPVGHSGHVQDRYACDLGDYPKLGLLRWLAPPGSLVSPRLGVVWYRTADEAHNGDGKHVAYLDPGHRSSAQLRQLDPDLYQRLARLVASGQRSTAALAKAGVLGARTCFFADLLDFADLPVAARVARQERRRSWAQRALAATSGCDLIFADPDNGIRPASHGVPPHRTKAAKHAYLSELAAFAVRGQSLIVYHHADRTAGVEQQARRRLADLAGDVPVQPIAAVRASRGTVRLFLVGAATASHACYLTERLVGLERGPWGTELAVYWAD